MTDAPTPPSAETSLDPASIVRSRAYLSALVLAALLGIPISAIAYGFLALVTDGSRPTSSTISRPTSSAVAPRPGGRCPG